jgi:hypothetical protein
VGTKPFGLLLLPDERQVKQSPGAQQAALKYGRKIGRLRQMKNLHDFRAAFLA